MIQGLSCQYLFSSKTVLKNVQLLHFTGASPTQVSSHIYAQQVQTKIAFLFFFNRFKIGHKKKRRGGGLNLGFPLFYLEDLLHVKRMPTAHSTTAHTNSSSKPLVYQLKMVNTGEYILL